MSPAARPCASRLRTDSVSLSVSLHPGFASGHRVASPGARAGASRAAAVPGVPVVPLRRRLVCRHGQYSLERRCHCSPFFNSCRNRRRPPTDGGRPRNGIRKIMRATTSAPSTISPYCIFVHLEEPPKYTSADGSLRARWHLRAHDTLGDGSVRIHLHATGFNFPHPRRRSRCRGPGPRFPRRCSL